MHHAEQYLGFTVAILGSRLRLRLETPETTLRHPRLILHLGSLGFGEEKIHSAVRMTQTGGVCDRRRMWSETRAGGQELSLIHI